MTVNDPLEAAKMADPSTETTMPDATVDRRAMLGELTKDVLYDMADELDITGRSKMNKGELILAIVHAEAQAAKGPEPETQPPVPTHPVVGPGSVPEEGPQGPQELPEGAQESTEAEGEGEGIPEEESAPDSELEPLGVVEVEVGNTDEVEVARDPVWAVQNKVTIGWGGGIVLKLRPGTHMGWRTHGVGCHDKLRNAGVKLTPVNDDAIDIDEEAGL